MEELSNLSNCKVMVVDDVGANIDVLLEALSDDYKVSVAMDGETALEDIVENMPDIILLDVMMPDIDGYEVCKRLKEDPQTRNIPVIFLTALSDEQNEAKGLSLGAVDYITKPFNPELVRSRVKNHLKLKLYQDHLEKLVDERTNELQLTQEVVIQSMGTLAEYRDSETGGHIKRTQSYIKLLCERLRYHPKFCDYLDYKTIDLICKSAPLHDIGKIGVHDSILLKPGKLTKEEFEAMKKHTIYGKEAIHESSKTLGKNSFLVIAEEIAYHHHEKWDGTGYPQQLKGEAIPIASRIMAIADVYDALISKRVYKEPYSHEFAKNILLQEKGKHFDPDIIDVFIELHEKFHKIALKFADFDEERKKLSENK
ncbi:MAG: two-component system response regulator [Desulfobacterales bacterium]|nr:two-component system response regulator [Desulfobacterales bacterium]